jgi:hypothetical protein
MSSIMFAIANAPYSHISISARPQKDIMNQNSAIYATKNYCSAKLRHHLLA